MTLYGTQRSFGYHIQPNSELIAYYDSMGARDGDLALALALAGNPDEPEVLEIGCGIGREAAVICQWTSHYSGIEESASLIEICKKRIPEGTFTVANPAQYNYGSDKYDVVCSFAALRHFDKDLVTAILHAVRRSLKVGGVCYLSLNYGDHYAITVRHDRFGERTIALYNPEVIMRLAGPGYKKVLESTSTVLGERWFEVALQRMT